MRKSKIPESLQAAIKIRFQEEVSKGTRGVYDRVVKSFDEPGDRHAGNGTDGKPLKLTKAMVKNIVSPPEPSTIKKARKEAKAAKEGLQKKPKLAKKPVKTARKVKDPVVKSDFNFATAEKYVKTLEDKAEILKKIIALLN